MSSPFGSVLIDSGDTGRSTTASGVSTAVAVGDWGSDAGGESRALLPDER